MGRTTLYVGKAERNVLGLRIKLQTDILGAYKGKYV